MAPQIIEKPSKRVLLIASGGDAPGMNPCLEAMYLQCKDMGYKAFGASGYGSLIRGNWRELNDKNATGISHETGCVLGSERCRQFLEPAGFDKAVESAGRNFDAVVVMGGDGSLKGAHALGEKGIKTIWIPTTIDNGIPSTDLALGFQTAAAKGAQLVDNSNKTLWTSHKHHLAWIMGERFPNLANHVAEVTNAVLVDTVDKRYTPEQMADALETHLAKTGKHGHIVLQERVEPGKRNQSDEEVLRAQIRSKVAEVMGNEDIRNTFSGYEIRGAPPIKDERKLARDFGRRAVGMVNHKAPNAGIGIKDGEIVARPLNEIISMLGQ